MTIKLSNRQQEIMEMFTTLFYTPSTNEAAEASRYDYISKYLPSAVKSLVDKGLITTISGSAYWLTDEGKVWAMAYMVANGYREATVAEVVEVATVAEVEAVVNRDVLQAKSDLEAADFGGIVIEGDSLVMSSVSLSMKVDDATRSIVWTATIDGKLFGYGDCGAVVELAERAFRDWSMNYGGMPAKWIYDQPVQQQQAQHKTAGGSTNPPAASPQREETNMNTNNNTNLVEVNMTQELANELHAKGIAYDAIEPTKLTNVAGQSITISAHFTEANHKSPAWWHIVGQNLERRADGLTEVIRILRRYGVSTKLDRELTNLARAIRLTGRNAEVSGLNVVYGDRLIEVKIMGFNPCYGIDGKWTYRLDDLFTWLGIDTFNGIKLYSPVEFSYDKYNVKCEAIGVFIGFRFDWLHNRGTRILKNVGAFSWVVTEGELLGGGIESDDMMPYTITEDKPFICGYRGEVRPFNLVGASVLPELQAHAKLVLSQSPNNHSAKLAADWLKLEQPIIDVGRDGAIEYISSKDVGLHVKGDKHGSTKRE